MQVTEAGTFFSARGIQVPIPQGKYLYASDQFLLSIIKQAWGDRPIFFASTTNVQYDLGLFPYVARQGLAFKLVTPQEGQALVKMPEGSDYSPGAGRVHEPPVGEQAAHRRPSSSTAWATASTGPTTPRATSPSTTSTPYMAQAPSTRIFHVWVSPPSQQRAHDGRVSTLRYQQSVHQRSRAVLVPAVWIGAVPQQQFDISHFLREDGHEESCGPIGIRPVHFSASREKRLHNLRLANRH
jgi:hypothetical protein